MSAAEATWSVPVEHLDYSFIQSCSDLKHLEQILRVLRSGQDGFYPQLIEFCEEHIEQLDPESRVLRKENRAATAASFSAEEWRSISEDLQVKHHRAASRLLLILCRNTSYTAFTQSRSQFSSASYNTLLTCEVCLISSSRVLLSSALSAQEKEQGNQAFRSGDYEEAVAYYSRSLSLASSAAVFNNRAQAHIRLQCWSAALNDCDAALQLEPGNVKALLRRATAHKHLGRLQESHDDLRAVLLIEPHNATAQKLLMDETESDGRQETCSTGRKILIQEEEEDEGEDECLWIERETVSEVMIGDQIVTDTLNCGISESCLRALCFIKLHCFTEAQQDCDSALQLQPTNKKAFYRRALANKGLKVSVTVTTH
uniref:Sperm associated antigen 1b n=1 Tax=Sinocyclocheilus grahami TaxID=75366 RepID=A0A672PJV8_SINGR